MSWKSDFFSYILTPILTIASRLTGYSSTRGSPLPQRRGAGGALQKVFLFYNRTFKKGL